MKKITHKLLLLTTSVGLLVNPSFAETTYAIVIGIDKYTHKPSLRGAVNDANDITASLRRSGVSNITTLLNEQASREAIEKVWTDTVTVAKPNDRIIFTYAGHGSQVRDKNGDEKLREQTDTLDERFLLGDFDEKTAVGQRQQILDDEFYLWLSQATSKDINVLVVADSCNSGDGYRQLSFSGSSRTAPVNWDEPDLLDDPIMAPPADEVDLSGRLMYISGSKSTETVKEIEIVQNKKAVFRGALSMAFSKALSNADHNRDGGISIDEIKSFIEAETKNSTEKNQTPTFAPTRGSNYVFGQAAKVTETKPKPVKPELTRPRLAAKPESPKPNIIANSRQIQLKITGDIPVFIKNIPEIAISNTAYDIHWDINTGSVFNKTNDLIAANVKGQDGISRIVSRRQLIDTIYQLSKAPNRFVSGNLGKTESQTHKIGEKISFNLEGITKPHFYQFNIAGNGVIQCFSKAIYHQSDYDFHVTDPVGNDTLVSIAVPEPISSLDESITSSGQCANDPSDLVKLLPQALKEQDYQINHVDIFVEK